MNYDKINLRGEPEWFKDLIRTLRKASKLHERKGHGAPRRQHDSALAAEVAVSVMLDIGRAWPADTWVMLNQSWETGRIRKETSLKTLNSFAKNYRRSHKLKPYGKQKKGDPWPSSYEKWFKIWMPKQGKYDTDKTRVDRFILCCFNAEKALELELPAEDPKELNDKVPGEQRELTFLEDIWGIVI
jgi:hypothetical protein